MVSTAAVLVALLFPSQTPSVKDVHQRLTERLKAATGLSYEIDVVQIKQGETKPFMSLWAKALRPNLLAGESAKQAWYSDGTKSYLYYPDLKEYVEIPLDADSIWLPMGHGLYDYCVPKYKPEFIRAVEATFMGKTAISLESEPKEVPGMVVKIYVDKEQWLPLGWEQVTPDATLRGTYKNIRTDAKLSPEDFRWSPPAGSVDMRKKTQPVKLLPTGSAAPMFAFRGPKGEKLDMKAMLKGKKGLLLNFWYYGCGYCQLEFPHLQKLYEVAKAKGLEVILVNKGEDSDKMINEFISKSKLTMPVAANGADAVKAYKVEGYPTNYLIDAEGKIVHRSMGYSEASFKELVAAAKKLGID